MNVWWYDTPPNYGDVLTPHILNAYGIPFIRAEKKNFDTLMVGSIAKWARPGTRVLGAGFIRKVDPVCKDANWKWVRGPLSRQMVLDAGGRVPEVYGDAAWLLPTFWGPSEKEFDLGIVPHHVDYEIAKELHPGIPVIDLLTTDPEKTTKEITKCKAVICSSLHGLIVAHAYGIPAAWVKYSDKLHGDDMKFKDHFASMGIETILSTYDNPVFTLGTLDTKPMIEILKLIR